VDRQSVSAESLWQYGHDAARIPFIAEPHHEIVRIADQEGLSGASLYVV